MTITPYGFRIVGATSEPRRLVDATAAFAGYAACDKRAEVHREAYLSAFQFGEDFPDYLAATGSTAGYAGLCWASWLWWDVDRTDLGLALKEARRIAAVLYERYCPSDDDLLAFFSGSKGFHLGLPTCLWSPAPSLAFHRTARRFAEHVAALAGVAIDSGVYDRVRAFRAPNSRHPKTGRHKRRFTLDELNGLPLQRVVELSGAPAPFDLPEPKGTSDQAAADWQAAVASVAQESEAKAARRTAGNGRPTLNRSTLEFIRAGASAGDRHRLLFSAAANLAEFGCQPALAVALLEEAALDSGLAPKEVRRQIECGLAAGASKPQASSESPPTVVDDSNVQEPTKRIVGDSGASEGQSCQQVTGATESTPPELQAALAKLWAATPTPKAEPGDTVPLSPAGLPPDPPPLIPLPPGAVGSGTLDKPCRCGSTEYADVAISEGRTRRDCRKCGRFVGFGNWQGAGGTP